MLFSVIVGLIAIILALNGLLFQTKNDPNEHVSWQNLNKKGRLLLVLILSLGLLNIIKSLVDDRRNVTESAKKDSQISSLMQSQGELKETNGHLIRVMSVASGYNALVRGIIAFNRSVTESQFRHAAENLFLKYVAINIRANNKLGWHEGRIDYANHPVVWKFRNLSQIGGNSLLSPSTDGISGIPKSQQFFFEVKCTNIKVLSRDKIQYAKLDGTDSIGFDIEEFPYSSDFHRLYNVAGVLIEEIEIEELGKTTIQTSLTFRDTGPR